MNKAVLGTIIGATLLGLAKNRGSMARTIADSKALNDRFKSLNGFGFTDFCSFLTTNILNGFFLNGNFKKFQDQPFDLDGINCIRLIIRGDEKDQYAIKYKNLAGIDKYYQFLISRVCDENPSVFFNIDNTEEYNKANIKANDVLNKCISDFKKNPSKNNAQYVFQTLVGGYFNPGDSTYRDQLSIQVLDTDEKNTIDIIALLQDSYFFREFQQIMFHLIIHEFFHAIEPVKEKNMEGKENTDGAYYASKRERPTVGNDIVMTLIGKYPDLSDLEKKEVLDTIRNRDFGTMLIYEKHLLGAFNFNKDLEQAYLLMFHKMGGVGEYNEKEYARLARSVSDQYSDMVDDVYRNEYNDYLKNKYKDRKSFYSLHKWFDMLETAFKDRGLL